MVSQIIESMKTINIGKEFSDTPLGRYTTDSKFSGERFREEFLKPALSENEVVSVEIDDAEGYGSSFLDEAFGGLVRKGYFSAEQLQNKLKIACHDPAYALYQKLIWKYITEARK